MPIVDADSEKNQPVRAPRSAWLRSLGGVLGLVAIACYSIAIVVGWLPLEHRLSISDLAVIVVGLLAVGLAVWPQLLERVQLLEFANVKIELRDLRNNQNLQKAELDDLRLALSMLVTDSERKHLQNLEAGKASNYKSNSWLLTELRRLRSLGLIDSKRYFSDIPSSGAFNLAEYAEVTPKGKDYLRRMKE